MLLAVGGGSTGVKGMTLQNEEFNYGLKT